MKGRQCGPGSSKDAKGALRSHGVGCARPNLGWFGPNVKRFVGLSKYPCVLVFLCTCCKCASDEQVCQSAGVLVLVLCRCATTPSLRLRSKWLCV